MKPTEAVIPFLPRQGMKQNRWDKRKKQLNVITVTSQKRMLAAFQQRAFPKEFQNSLAEGIPAFIRKGFVELTYKGHFHLECYVLHSFPKLNEERWRRELSDGTTCYRKRASIRRASYEAGRILAHMSDSLLDFENCL